MNESEFPPRPTLFYLYALGYNLRHKNIKNKFFIILNMVNYIFKKDKYRKSRGEYSRLINVYCRKCNSLVAIYQKDGPGNLRRMYLDRIFDPIYSFDNSLKCKSCGIILGTPVIYEKENRKAFRLYQDAVVKKIRKIGVS